MKPIYYIVTDMGYDGFSVIGYDNKKEAMLKYKEIAIQCKRGSDTSLYEGVAILKGTLIESKDLELLQ